MRFLGFLISIIPVYLTMEAIEHFFKIDSIVVACLTLAMIFACEAGRALQEGFNNYVKDK